MLGQVVQPLLTISIHNNKENQRSWWSWQQYVQYTAPDAAGDLEAMSTKCTIVSLQPHSSHCNYHSNITRMLCVAIDGHCDTMIIIIILIFISRVQ